MKKNKLIYALTSALLAGCLTVGMAACGGTKPDEGEQSDGTQQQQPVTVAPEITAFDITADEGSKFGKLNETHVVSYTVKGTYTSAEITAQKDGSATTAFTYTAQTKKIVFTQTGNYKVVFTVKNGDKAVTSEKSVAVTDFSNPVITTTLSSDRVYVGDHISVSPSASYAEGDAEGSFAVSVTYKESESGTFGSAEGKYLYAQGLFTPTAAGYFKIKIIATSSRGKTAEREYSVRCMDQGEIELSHVDDGSFTVETGTDTTLGYTVVGDAEEYAVSVTAQNGITAREGEGSSIIVNAASAGNYTVTVRYTNKADSGEYKELSFTVTAKTDINAPQLGADPFGGTAREAVPNIGLLLYYDATDDKAEIGYDKVTYEIVGGTLQNTAQIEKVSDQNAYPYFYSPSAGTAVIRISVTDGVNVSSAEATFTVTAVGGQYATYEAYGNAVYGGAHGLLLDNGTGDTSVNGRNSLIITKTGVIVNRNGAASLDGVMGLVYCGDLGDNFEVSFDVTPIANNTGWNTVIFAMFSESTWMGNFYANWENSGPIGGSSGDAAVSGRTTGGAVAGEAFHVRFVRTVSNGTITFTLTCTASDGSSATHTKTASVSNTSNTWSKNITNISLNHLDGGIYMVENITASSR